MSLQAVCSLLLLLTTTVSFSSAKCSRCEQRLGAFCCATAWRGVCCEVPLAFTSGASGFKGQRNYRNTDITHHNQPAMNHRRSQHPHHPRRRSHLSELETLRKLFRW